MRDFDLSPLYSKTVGFDQVFNLFDRMLAGGSGNGGYPPYNIERIEENVYRITMAVAGFSPDELSIEVKEDTLNIRGEAAGSVSGDAEQNELLYQGIGMRSFERRFHLAEHVKVDGAEQENGLLKINLVKEIPEAAKPRKIGIKFATIAKDAKKAVSSKVA